MRNLLNRVLNLLLYLCFASLLGTGMMLKFRLPPGSRGGHGLTALGLDRHEWGDIHFWLSIAFLLLVALHLILNWPWLKRVAAPRHPILLPLAFVVGIALTAIPLWLPVDRPTPDGKEGDALHHGDDRADDLGKGKGQGKGQGRGYGRALRSRETP